MAGLSSLKIVLKKKTDVTLSAELHAVKTSEPLSGAELVKQELIIKSVTSQMETFDRSELRHTEMVERNLLPDASTLREERGKADLLSGRPALMQTCSQVDLLSGRSALR